MGTLDPKPPKPGVKKAASPRVPGSPTPIVCVSREPVVWNPTLAVPVGFRVLGFWVSGFRVLGIWVYRTHSKLEP